MTLFVWSHLNIYADDFRRKKVLNIYINLKFTTGFKIISTGVKDNERIRRRWSSWFDVHFAAAADASVTTYGAVKNFPVCDAASGRKTLTTKKALWSVSFGPMSL